LRLFGKTFHVEKRLLVLYCNLQYGTDMPRNDRYKVVTISKSLYEEVINVTGAQSFSEALRQLIPKCIQGYTINGHIFIKAKLLSLTIEDVAYIDVSGISIRLDYLTELLWEATKIPIVGPIIGILGGLWFLSGILKGEIKVVPKPETVELNTEGYFLVDTGATLTVINTSLLPNESRVTAMLTFSLNKESVHTASDVISVARGVAIIKIDNIEIEEQVLLMGNPSLRYHILGVNTLRRIFGEKVLLDFGRAKVCRLNQ